MEKQYPRLVCDLKLLEKNAREVATRCHAAGITLAGVVKGVNSRLPMVERFLKGGCDQLASSRMEQIRALKEAFPDTPAMLVRVPMLCELEEVARWCDYSLQSDLDVLRELDRVCGRLGVRHKVVLMADLGDLREGWWDRDEMVAAAVEVEERLKNLELAGVGTNLGCYGAIVPTVEKMEELCDIAGRIEGAIGRKLEIVSGGATSSFQRVHFGDMPKGINHLRVGEGILLCYDLQNEWRLPGLEYLSNHVFTIQTQVLECRDKPSYPVGERAIDAFGNRPEYEDLGIRRRALVGIGKLDVGDPKRMIPKESGIQVMGDSSDHTILDVTECARPLKAGDVVEFDLTYGELLYLTNRNGLEIEYLE